MYMPPMYNAPFQMPMQPNFNQSNLAPALYVGDLDESITEEMLYDHFSKYGPIFYIKLARDLLTKKSKGFAYVNFFNPRDAESARSLSLYEKLGNKPIRVMFRKSNIKELHEGNLFVKNIDPPVTIKEFHNCFSEIGNVLSAKIATDSKGQSLGYGYVQYEKGEDADKAIEKLNGLKLKEKEINISHFASIGERLPNTKRNLYVKHLPANCSTDELESKLKVVFEPFGEIETLLVKKSEGEDKYFAFICYKEQNDAQKSFDYFNSGTHDPLNVGVPIYVAWHQNRVERILEFKKKYNDVAHPTNLYLKNLKAETSEAKLAELFSEYGQVASVGVKEWKAPTGLSSKFGFVDFKSQSDCYNALTNASKNKEIAKLFVNSEPYIGLYQTREQRNKYLQIKNMFNPMTNLMQNSMPYYPTYPQPPVNMVNSGFRNASMPFFPPYQGQQQQFNRYMPGGRGPMQQSYGQKFKYVPKRRPYEGGHQGGGYQGNYQGGYQGGYQNKYEKYEKFDKNQQNASANPQNKTADANAVGTKPEFEGEFVNYEKIKANLGGFLNLTQEKQRTILGNLLFPIITQREGGDLAPKITGMLIDLNVLEVTDVLEFFEDPVKLDERVGEARTIILSEQEQEASQ